jgi:hypothetical protein
LFLLVFLQLPVFPSGLVRLDSQLPVFQPALPVQRARPVEHRSSVPVLARLGLPLALLLELDLLDLVLDPKLNHPLF